MVYQTALRDIRDASDPTVGNAGRHIPTDGAIMNDGPGDQMANPLTPT